MKHHEYKEGETFNHNIDKKTVLTLKLSTIGVVHSSKVQATWTKTGGKTGVAFGGFQEPKDFDFQAAASLAVENAISQASA